MDFMSAFELDEKLKNTLCGLIQHKVSSSGKMDRMGVRESIDLLIAAVCYLVCRM